MAYTGHKDPLINGQTIVEHIKEGVKHECRYYGIDMPGDMQMAVVISQLRMHPTMAHAVDYDFSELGKPDVATDFYPIASSVGRFLRDSAQITLDKGELNQPKPTKESV